MLESNERSEVAPYGERRSASSCHFFSNQIKQNGQFTSGLDKDVSLALKSAYQANCQKAVIHVYHVVIDGYVEQTDKVPRIRSDLFDNFGKLEIQPANINLMLEAKKSVGEFYVKTIYTGFLAMMKIK